jgi:hypothetical protein
MRIGEMMETSGRDRPKTRFLLVVWGKAYVDGLMSAALPSFLAPGNLPALAERTDLEVVIMTTLDTVIEFSRHAAFAHLERLCPVHFVLIDDLVRIPNYGLVLTAAFARGIMAAGAEQTDIHFVFMNADFILADGSLRSLAARILAGERCIVAPSLRAREEPLLPELAKAAAVADHVLARGPRDLVGLALAHLHPTVIAKTVNQALVHSEPCNQLYWRVDDATLLGRYYLMFMLCIRPERPLERVSSWCDTASCRSWCLRGASRRSPTPTTSSCSSCRTATARPHSCVSARPRSRCSRAGSRGRPRRIGATRISIWSSMRATCLRP